MSHPIIILGAGPTGLAAAYKLTKKGEKVIVLEKEKYLGGLSATLKHDNFLYEFGPHAFHIKDPQITDWLKKLIGKDFRVISTNTQVLIDGKFYEYPLRAGDLIRKISPVLAVKIILGYLWAYLKKLFRQGEYLNFEDWGLANFGKTLYKISFGDYTRKVWGMDPKLISRKLASSKLSRLNLGDLIYKLLGFKGQNQETYFKKYLYPKKGVGVILGKIVQEITSKNKIIYASEVTKISCQDNAVQEIEYLENGHPKKLKASFVISTITLKDLVRMINHPFSKKTQLASQKLIYRDMIIVYLISRNKFSQSQWIYLVENKFRFNRITFLKNLSPAFGPKNLNLLSLEICCQKDDELWQYKDYKLYDLALEETKLLGINPEEISGYFVRRIENAYPIYLKDFEKDLEQVYKNLSQVNNLISTGRNGFFLNSDIHDSFLMGFEAADMVMSKAHSNRDWYQKAEEKWLKGQ